MASILLQVVIILSLGALVWSDSSGSVACKPLQYVEFGITGVLQCDYQNYFSVIWYNSSDHINDDPIVYFTKSVKSGTGYSSGEFDVEENGSLVIKNVSLQHDHNFTVIKLDTSDDISYPTYIQVVVIVKPSQTHPVIDICGVNREFCFTEVFKTLSLSCSVNDARPAPYLTWLKRNDSGDFATSNELSIVPGQITYTTRATTTIVQSNVVSLELLVCKSFSPIPILQNNQSYILIQHFPLQLTSVKAVEMLGLLHSKMKIHCTDGNISNIVWKFQRLNHEHEETILFGSLDQIKNPQILSEGYELDNEGALIINAVNFEDEGLYGCIWGKNTLGGSNTFNLTAYVPAVPKNPVVDECGDTSQYCVLQVAQEGILTCKLYGIRPIVHLEWMVVSRNSSATIKFFDETVQVEGHQDTFDIALTSRFVVKSMLNDRFTIQCKTTDTEWHNFHLSTQIDLLYIYEPTDPLHRSGWALIIIVAVAVPFVILGVTLLSWKACKKRVKPRASAKNVTEGIPMLSKDGALRIKEKKEVFQQQLRGKYEDLCEAIQPIPYIRNKYFSVEKLFVETEMLWQQPNDSWKNLNSVQDIFRTTSSRHNRLLLEGDPGYGKTTITLQIAYDWCNKKSYLKDVEILILIRLRQLSDISSIYKAIKYLLLPKDTPLSETDIENIMQSTISCLIILDGFDEYSDQEDNSNSDSEINDIIERNMFQNFKVIITTRSSCLPKHFVAHTGRIKLTGFNDFAREKYIKKTALYNTKEYKDEIKRRLYANPVIGDICQVPLFFVMFTHMAYENQDLLDVKSVTGFFKCVIACIYSHMEKKMTDKNVKPVTLFEDDHTKLDKVAFDSLYGNATQTSWNKEHLGQLIGVNLRDQYIRTGILVEEETVVPAERFEPTTASPIIYKTEVRFFHRLFCEWYAAHYVAQLIEKADKVNIRSILHKLNPFQLHYVYRFACGLSEIAALKVIEYLNETDDGSKLACLCLLEQTGNFDKLEENIRKLCLKEIVFGKGDSRLLHRSTIQLLEIASNRKINISCLHLSECINYVTSEDGRIILSSDVVLPKLASAQRIVITERRKVLSKKDIEYLFEYVSLCPQLKSLGFYWCMLPEIFQNKKQLATFKARRVKVTWKPIEGSQMSFHLDLKVGIWEDETDGVKMTRMEYKQIVSMFQSSSK